MSSNDVNDRKQKLNNIIKKITEGQLLKIRAADDHVCNNSCNSQACKFTMSSQERDNEEDKTMSIKLLNEKKLSHFVKPEVAGPSSELPAGPVGPGVTL